MATLSGKKLVIVESPTKAKTIRKFLDAGYVVESCMGHVRDLPQSSKDIPEKFKKEKWAQLGVDCDNHFEPLYCIPKDKLKVVKNLKEKMSGVDEVYLATDEDREGESISWHLFEILKPKVPVKRMVFNEITKKAIQAALKDTRSIDLNLVHAQEARRILDRLVGYTISPLLWKKIAYGLSAGRVQSVALRLVVERERLRLKFKSSVYWDLEAALKKNEFAFDAKIHSHQGKRIAQGRDFDSDTGELQKPQDVLLLNEKSARELAAQCKSKSWVVDNVEEKLVSRRPGPPFITSSLQQEANRKFGWGARETMQIAQKLYEQGFITYMRTDSTFLSEQAIQASRSAIAQLFGKEYLPDTPRRYDAKKVKGAQEAHEAIRPAGEAFVPPKETGLEGQQFKLYELIWQKTLAGQMVESKQKQVSAKILSGGETMFNATGTTIEFPGYLRVYREEDEDKESKLPALKKGDVLGCVKVDALEHETKPAARYTDASLIQKMEKEGIGRPSTYASIISTIVDRGYVKKNGTALLPTFTAFAVSDLLEKHLTRYVDMGFTSQMERSLDEVAEGDLEAEEYLKKIYFGDEGLKNLVSIQDKKIDPEEARTINLQGFDNFQFKVGKYGAYLITVRDGEEFRASIPESEAPADLTIEKATRFIDQKISGADAIGNDPTTGLPIYVLSGRYGPYVQLGDAEGEGAKPKRVSLPVGVTPETLTLAQAILIASLPKLLGSDPASQNEIKMGVGRFGPYIVIEKEFRSIPKGESIFEMNLDKALALLAQPKKGKGRGTATVLREMGEHPEAKKIIQILNGPYGPYFKMGTKNASLPEGATPESVTLEQAVELLDAKFSSGKKGGKRGSGRASKARTRAANNVTRTVKAKRRAS